MIEPAPASSVRFDVLTIFPGMFSGPLDQSILQRARDAGLIEVHLHDLRDWAHDRHRTVDDYPFGGGAGMVMKPEPLFEAIDAIQPQAEPPAYVIFPGPQGRPLDRALVAELAARPRLLFICGRYEGIDERVLEHVVDLEVSIGDFVVSGGELPSMLIMDAVARQIPGVLGGEGSLAEESFEDGLLEYPQYTRPAEFRDWAVPDILLSGHHAEIEKWRRRQRLLRTLERRPDLLEGAQLTEAERRWVAEEGGAVGEAPGIIPEFKVSDLRRSLRFYRQILGFSVLYERPEHAFAYLQREGAHLMLEEPGRSRTFHSSQDQHPYGRGMHLQIEVSDIEPLWAAAQAVADAITYPLEDRWYRRGTVELGNRQFVMQDPDGYLLRFFEDLGSRPAGSA